MLSLFVPGEVIMIFFPSSSSFHKKSAILAKSLHPDFPILWKKFLRFSRPFFRRNTVIAQNDNKTDGNRGSFFGERSFYRNAWIEMKNTQDDPLPQKHDWNPSQKENLITQFPSISFLSCLSLSLFFNPRTSVWQSHRFRLARKLICVGCVTRSPGKKLFFGNL